MIQHIKNFRDVGETINILLDAHRLKEQMLYRGGRLNAVFTHEELLNIPTILNLRSGKDEKKFDSLYLHVPATDKLENYDTKNRDVRKWVNRVIGEMLQDEIKFPLYLHCTSGKDRTGVIVAVILKALGIEDELIVEEYLLSDGVEGARDIKRALDGVGDVEVYLKSGYVVSLKKIFEIGVNR